MTPDAAFEEGRRRAREDREAERLAPIFSDARALDAIAAALTTSNEEKAA